MFREAFSLKFMATIAIDNVYSTESSIRCMFTYVTYISYSARINEFAI